MIDWADGFCQENMSCLELGTWRRLGRSGNWELVGRKEEQWSRINMYPKLLDENKNEFGNRVPVDSNCFLPVIWHSGPSLREESI